MTQKLYTPEDVAHYLGISEYTVSGLIRSKQLGCCRIGGVRRITEAQVDQYIKLAASRPPRKKRVLPPIPEDLAPVWEQLTAAAHKQKPLLAPFMADATLVSIHKQSLTATVQAHTPQAAEMIAHKPNRLALQEYLRNLFCCKLKICITCS